MNNPTNISISQNAWNVIESLFHSFSDSLLEIKYSFDQISDTHFIELPFDLFVSEDFADFESQINSHWIDSQNDNLCFIHEKSATKLGRHVKLPNFNNWQALFSNIRTGGKTYPKNKIEESYSEIINFENTNYGIETSGESNYAMAA